MLQTQDYGNLGDKVPLKSAGSRVQKGPPFGEARPALFSSASQRRAAAASWRNRRLPPRHGLPLGFRLPRV